MIKPWNPSQADGWWPQLHVLGSRIFVAYGNGSSWLAELKAGMKADQPALVTVREFQIPVPAARAGQWIGPGLLTFMQEVSNGRANRWTLDVTKEPWAPTLEPDDATLVAGNIFRADGGHWASYLATKPARVALDGRLLASGTGGALDQAGDYVVHADTPDHTGITLYQHGKPLATLPALVPLHLARVGPDGSVLYGGYGRVFGIDPGGKQREMTVTPWRWENPIQVFAAADGQTWAVSLTFDPGDPAGGWILLRPWDAQGQAILAIQAAAVEGHVASFLDHWLVAWNGERGQLQVQAVPKATPLQVLKPRVAALGKKWAGYYYAQGKYGDFSPAANCTVLGLSMFADGDGTVPADAADRMRAAAKAAGAIFLAADQASMAAMRADWHLVAGVWLPEFPNTQLDALELTAAAAKTRMAEWGLPRRPVIATIMPDQVFQAGWRMPANVDWLAVEIYCEQPEADFGTQRKVVRIRVEQVTRKIPAGVPVILIAQAYDRSRPAWMAAPDRIEAILAEVADQAGAFTFIQGIWFFAYARKGGARDYPAVEAWCTAVVNAASRPDIVTLPDPVRPALTIRSFDASGAAPFTCRAVAAITAGRFDTLIWRWRPKGGSTWNIAATNPASDLDHHFRFTQPGQYEISLLGTFPGGSAATGAQRIVDVATQPPTVPGPPPTEGPKTMKIEDLPTYDEFVKDEGPALDAAAVASMRRGLTPAEIRHHGWRRLRENWTPENIIRAMNNQEPVDLVQFTPDFPGTPDYLTMRDGEGPEVDATFKRQHGNRPGPGDIRHNLYRRLVDGWTQEAILLDIQGLPNDGPTLQRPESVPRVVVETTRTGIVQAAGGAIVDDGGPFLGIGFSLFWALWGYLNDRDRLEQNLIKLSGRVHYIRVLAVVGPGGGWEDRTVNPNDPGFQEAVSGLMDLAYDTYGIRIEWSIFGGVDHTPDQASRRHVVERMIAAAQGRFHKVMHWEVANEAWQNGFSGDSGVAELRDLGRLLKDQTPNLVALSAATGDGYPALYKGSAATLATFHPDRNQTGTGGIWRPMRQPWEIHFVDGIPAVRSVNEPIGPQSSGSEDADPLRLTMLAMNSWLTGSALFVLHTGAGIRGGGAADLAKGRVANVWEVEHIDQTLAALGMLAGGMPGDLPNWSKQNGNTKFPDYPFQVEPLMVEADILRAYGAVAGSRFIVAPIQVRNRVPFFARRKMHVRVYDPLTATELQQADLDPGQAFWLEGSQAQPTAFIVLGEYR